MRRCTLTARPIWPLRAMMRWYLHRRVRWIETDVAADHQLLCTLPARIREHERVAANMRCQAALLED